MDFQMKSREKFRGGRERRREKNEKKKERQRELLGAVSVSGMDHTNSVKNIE